MFKTGVKTTVNKRGRPRKDSGKKSRLDLRVSEDDLKKLEYASSVLGMSKSDVIRNAIDVSYQMAKYKQ